MLMGGACGGRGYSRDGLRDAYVDKVVDSGVDRIVAECIIDRLFGEMTDDQLKVFNIEGSALSAEQTKRVVQLAGACGA